MIKKTRHYDRSDIGNQANIHFLPRKNAPALEGVGTFFTTRQGGVSQGAYASFNLGSHVEDRPEDVAWNRACLLASLAPHGKELAIVNQVHGRKTVLAGWQGKTPDADAVVTNQPGIVTSVLTADCAPVLFADVKARVVGAAHAGWRGALEGILESCMDSMKQLGARQENMAAIIGPCIGPDSYEVDEAFRNHFLQAKENKLGEECQKFFSNPQESCILAFNLPGYVQARLLHAGLGTNQIFNVELCTYALESLFFSHRRSVHQKQTPCGRQMAGIYLL
ncbi:MAG: peptidoglycan editing factor PgeF [Magnetococcus sp. YQC-5]